MFMVTIKERFLYQEIKLNNLNSQIQSTETLIWHLDKFPNNKKVLIAIS